MATPTIEMKLSPYWWLAAPRPDSNETTLPAHTEVLVVGSGYTGLSTALTLAKGGREVLIVDRQRAGEGASSRNAGLMSGALKHSFSSLSKRFGVEHARAMHGESAKARAYLHHLIDAEGIECGRKPSGRLTPAVTQAHYDAMARDADSQHRELGIDTYAVPRDQITSEIGSDLYFGAVVSEEVATFHPAQYHLGLMNSALTAGATLHANTEVLGITRDTDNGQQRFTVNTSAGKIIAREVVMATNGYTTAALGWWQRRVVPISSQMVATAPIGDNLMARLLPKGRAVIESNRLFHYFRPSPDGTRLLAGGRYGASRSGLLPGVEAIRRRLATVFPDLGEVEFEHTWDGYTAFTRDFYPHIGVHDGVHYAMGFCGSGTAWGTWFGHQMGLRILASAEAHSAFDSPLPGIPFYTGKPWFLAPAMGWYALCDRLGR